MYKIARQMRRKMTTSERLMWERLRGRRLGGFKFLRQHVVRDNERDFQLAAHGYRTVRVSNADVITDLDAVCKNLLDIIYAEIDHLLE